MAPPSTTERSAAKTVRTFTCHGSPSLDRVVLELMGYPSTAGTRAFPCCLKQTFPE